jgi:ribosomal protein S18 acetylase RimI-like enzyme
VADALGREGAVDVTVRRATSVDAPDIARLMHDFNTEFSEPIPEVPVLTDRYRRLLKGEDAVILVGGGGPDGFAQIRFRWSIYTGALDAYLEELYVAPARRGRGLGRALLEGAVEAAREEGAEHMDLGTSEDDTAARSLYESAGFTNREGRPDGPVMLYYERDL